MRNVRLVIEYDGTAYQGWQLQPPPQPTVQGALEIVLRDLTGEPALRVRGAGRTDAGVHARGQVANFFTESSIPARGLMLGANSRLPRDIVVLSCEDVALDFDARRCARGKIYRYGIVNRLVRSARDDRYLWHVRFPLDLGAMQAAARPLIGRHDFRAFRAANCERENTVRTVRRIDVTRGDDDRIWIEVEATAFLKNMVRIIAGTLVSVGLGQLTPADVAAVLASGDRRRAGMTAPAQGLEMVRVLYDPSGTPPPEWIESEREPGRKGAPGLGVDVSAPVDDEDADDDDE